MSMMTINLHPKSSWYGVRMAGTLWLWVGPAVWEDRERARGTRE